MPTPLSPGAQETEREWRGAKGTHLQHHHAAVAVGQRLCKDLLQPDSRAEPVKLAAEEEGGQFELVQLCQRADCRREWEEGSGSRWEGAAPARVVRLRARAGWHRSMCT